MKRRQEFNNEVDKTLFDFDDEIDNLSDVEERYKFNAGSNNAIIVALDSENRLKDKAELDI